MREENQLKIICRIIENYKLDVPLSRYLKDFFKAHPQMGSRDRRLASGFVYNYYRFGKSLSDLRLIERLTFANYLCSQVSNPLLAYCLEKFSLLKDSDVPNSSELKIAAVKSLHPQFNEEQFFPFSNYLSDNIDRKNFIDSFLVQPKLWIRIRKNFHEKVLNEFREKNIAFEEDEINNQSISLVNTTSLEKLDSFVNGYFEIQDWSSQQTINFIETKPNELWWDACSGSGGKSLMLIDAEPALNMFATDSRISVLKNLEERFLKAGLKNYKTQQLDLTLPFSELRTPNSQTINGVMADVPCSGSGTWARTPEWLTMFNENAIAQYVLLQRNIVEKIVPFINSETPLVYITCSVFKDENEMNVAWIESNTELSLVRSGYLEGAKKNADTMFAALFVKK